jgi:hypothetical protein
MLRGNGDIEGLLPKELFETVDAQAILAAYRGELQWPSSLMQERAICWAFSV